MPYLPGAAAPAPQLVRLHRIVRGRVRGWLADVLSAHGIIGGTRHAWDFALRRYRAAIGVRRHHCHFRAIISAARFKTSTSILRRLLSFSSSKSHCCSDVLLPAALLDSASLIPGDPVPHRGSSQVVLEHDFQSQLTGVAGPAIRRLRSSLERLGCCGSATSGPFSQATFLPRFSVWDSVANPLLVRRGLELGVRNVGRAGPGPGLGAVEGAPPECPVLHRAVGGRPGRAGRVDVVATAQAPAAGETQASRRAFCATSRRSRRPGAPGARPRRTRSRASLRAP